MGYRQRAVDLGTHVEDAAVAVRVRIHEELTREPCRATPGRSTRSRASPIGKRRDAVTCPGSVKAKAGESIRCELTAGKTRYGLTATVTSYEDRKAAYHVQVDNKPAT
jgi:hypothetical protein